MKKLLSLVLICAMGFGMISCVESEESQSVEALRNAKAEQLKALVNLYNAQAEAEKIMAEAEAAYQKARAAYEEAEAKLKDAEAEMKIIELQKLKDTYAEQLAALLAQYEASLLRQKALIAEAEMTLMTNLDALEDAVNARIQSLYGKYEEAIEALGTANKDLLDKKIAIASLEAEIVDIEEAANKDIADQMEIIAEQEEIIAEAEAQLAILTDNAYTAMDKDSLYVEYLKALVAYKDADLNYNQNEVKAEADARKEAHKAILKLGQDLTDYEKENGVTGKNLIKAATNDNEKSWPNAATGSSDDVVNATLNYYVSESDLNSFKATTFATDYAQGAKDAEADLETAKAAEAGFKGFEKAFEDAEAAKETIDKFVELKNTYYYGEANPTDRTVDNTVKYWEDNLATVKADTLSGNFETPLTKLYSAEAYLDVLTNDQNAGHATNPYVAALAAAEAALKALAADATAAEKAAAEAAVADAKAALNGVIYNAEVSVANAKAALKAYNDAIAEAEGKVEAAKEMEKELLEENSAAIAAVETLNNLFGSEGEFTKFWDEKDENGGLTNQLVDNDTQQPLVTIYTDGVGVLADKNVDGTPDIELGSDGKVLDGRYLDESLNYSYYASSMDYEDLLAEYTKNVAKATDDLTTANNNLANMGEWQSNWDAKEAELREFVKSLNAQIPAVQELVDAYTEAVEAAEKAKELVSELEAKKDALDGLVSVAQGDSDLNQLIDAITNESNGIIAMAEDEIKTAEEAIEKAEKILEGWTAKNGSGENSDATAWKEHKIEEYKAEIKELEAKIEYLTVQVENAKAALDAAISAANAE